MATLSEPGFWALTVLAEGPAHGYAVLRRVAELSSGVVSLRVTTLYATLERLEAQGLVVVVSEDVVDGRARRVYDLTPEGRGLLAAEAERLMQRARAAQRHLAQQTAPQLGTAFTPALP